MPGTVFAGLERAIDLAGPATWGDAALPCACRPGRVLGCVAAQRDSGVAGGAHGDRQTNRKESHVPVPETGGRARPLR